MEQGWGPMKSCTSLRECGLDLSVGQNLNAMLATPGQGYEPGEFESLERLGTVTEYTWVMVAQVQNAT